MNNSDQKKSTIRRGGFARLSVAACAARGGGGTKADNYCYACYTGNYPTQLVNIDDLLAAKDRRG